MKNLGLYIHIPFCIRKCPYCDFYSVCLDEDLKERYISSVVSCIEHYKDPERKVDSIYFGGGTPSLLTQRDIYRILETTNRSFSVDNAEITMEANPSSATFEKLSGYRKSGVNRISFGIQSLNDNELLDLGRLHNSKTAIEAINNAKKAGFNNLSADLMLGISRQTEESLCGSISAFSQLDIQHISAYILCIEERTPYSKMRNTLLLPDEEKTADLYLLACNELERCGFEQYEISNFAKKGFESRHNLKYWQLEEYLGIGPAAHSFYNCKRSYYPRDLEGFINGDFSMIDDDTFNPAEEYVMLSLRLKSGIDISIAKDFGVDTEHLLKKAKRFIDQNLAVFDGERLYLTKQGFLVSNYIISELM